MTAIHSVCLLATLGGGISENVLLDFTASWCGPCQQMAPIVARLQRQGLPVRTVDVDEHPELARRFGIQNIPAFVLVINGRETTRRIGLTSETTLRALASRALKAENQR
ncbi:MAG TPA: thioredoxin, partial [Planctomycetaceae bacterium]|nr:thioredoxin [Planctomycetaceae bacterium]